MTARETMDQNKDMVGWGMVSLFLGLISSPQLLDLLANAIVIILFPTAGWALLYFVKREITYRFPPKESKTLQDKNEEVIQ